MATVLQELNVEMAAVVEEVEHSLVQVNSYGGGTGAGTIWHPDGLVITNAHVVRRSPLTVSGIDGRILPARVLAYDEVNDLAALAIDASGLSPIKLGDSRRLKVGQLVVALGNPFGVRGAATAGVIIGVGPVWPETPGVAREWVVVNLHLRPGYSGGPLFDVNGRLVGINTMVTAPDIGMAVPIHVAKKFLNDSLRSQVVA
ncbi:MAG: trypsin-like peptidase domain-containing protein [Chloroflexi bacterium]|nr:trypsin-like peptidase domain-containing protein [Chloroflexota bacterium]